MRALGTAALLAALATAASAQTVDDFSTTQGPLLAPPTSWSSVTGPGILDGERDIRVELLSPTGAVTAEVNASGHLDFSSTTRGEAVVAWDGDDLSPSISTNGLGGIDVTTSADAVRLDVVSATAGTTLILEVFSGEAMSSTRAITLPAVSSSTSFILPYSTFAPRLGAGANLTSVGAIVLTIRGESVSFVLDAVALVTAPAPTVTASKDDGTSSPVAAGGVIQYEITIRNPQSSGPAAGVTFSDTLDANTTLVGGTLEVSPLAFDDAYTTNVVADPGVLANDVDLDPVPDTLTVSAFSATTSRGGSVSVNANGGFTYTPPAGFYGIDTFTYAVTDGTFSDTATVTVSGFTATAALSVAQNGNESGPINIVYSVTLSQPNNTGAPITFDVANSGGTATAGVAGVLDFVGFAGAAAISVANGASIGILTVLVNDDALLENTETVQATIINPSFGGVTIATPTATATILNNDSADARIDTTMHGSEAGPVDIEYTVSLTKTNNTGAPITFDIDKIGGTATTATSGLDYTAIAGAAQVSIPNGSQSGTFTVVVLDDTLLENTETVSVIISNSSHTQVTVVSGIASADITESGATADLTTFQDGNEAGPVPIIYRVALSKTNATGANVTFNLADATLTSGGTATAGDDYGTFGGTSSIRVANGQTTSASTGDFVVTVVDDGDPEATETVIATIDSPNHGAVTIGTAQASANILSE